jgi:hypothetical protein
VHPVLTIVPQSVDRLDEARALLGIVESWRPSSWLVALLLLPLLGVALVLSGVLWGGFFVGAAVSLALCRYGPHWWPGRR